MGYHFATAALGPLLLAQGRHVRRVTPRLAEADGPRSGIDGAGPPLRLLVLGDSAAAGVGVATQSDALVGQLVRVLAPFHRVEWKLLARTGATTQDLLDWLAAEPAARFDAVVTSLGVNDVTDGVSPGRWRDTQAALVELLTTRFGAAHVILSAVPPMHHFPALPQPLRWYLGLRARRLNTTLSRWAAGQRACEFLRVEMPLTRDAMASDGFHPGARACALWAEQAAAAIRRRFGG
ncbi:SGNH/GDSL hydrolase family protein [Burkholderia oklahomensis]|uniref:GDSL-like Lipase/Acylhydrolase family protein n=2 Tax=Burkholderia oklahomensis TaxID=342113 RepID=A0AAI8FPY8_9BURK|nr:SGNH/GDSL hydrolase family protein [Burkholderia oklahomensis]AIO68420.1 GDSL-like Lipase/Acylhydrolase family protein [Burkholderia oklahomensis]AOI40855.1 lipase [Burkholderia oklahomensis EO147]KUY55429.1 lipase [Burkholderia oklahomensis EO147]QPS38948.1 SGNH/GDSL hydrolase family protein [Burkholderia oklahomensis]